MKLTPINGNTETEGTEYIYRGISLIVARANNTEFKKVFRDAMKPFKDEFDAGRLDEKQSNKIMIECTAKTILVGWNDFKDVDGQDWDYNVDNAISLLTDDSDAYDAIVAFSENIDNYLTTSAEKLKVK
jgi:hypothetical protein